MIYLTGSKFWNDDVKGSDNDYIKIIFPTKDDLYNCNKVSTSFKMDSEKREKYSIPDFVKEGDDFTVKDIRVSIKELSKGSLKQFESLLYGDNLEKEEDTKARLLQFFIKDNKNNLYREMKNGLEKFLIFQTYDRLDKLRLRDDKFSDKSLKEMANVIKCFRLSNLIEAEMSPFIYREDEIVRDIRNREISLNNLEDELLKVSKNREKKKDRYDKLKDIINAEEQPTFRELEDLVKELCF